MLSGSVTNSLCEIFRVGESEEGSGNLTILVNCEIPEARIYEFVDKIFETVSPTR